MKKLFLMIVSSILLMSGCTQSNLDENFCKNLNDSDFALIKSCSCSISISSQRIKEISKMLCGDCKSSTPIKSISRKTIMFISTKGKKLEITLFGNKRFEYEGKYYSVETEILSKKELEFFKHCIESKRGKPSNVLKL